MADRRIRINTLAKELGLDSKVILDDLRSRGLGDCAPNHMSMVDAEFAEAIRGWMVERPRAAPTASIARPSLALDAETSDSRDRYNNNTVAQIAAELGVTDEALIGLLRGIGFGSELKWFTVIPQELVDRLRREKERRDASGEPLVNEAEPELTVRAPIVRAPAPVKARKSAMSNQGPMSEAAMLADLEREKNSLLAVAQASTGSLSRPKSDASVPQRQIPASLSRRPGYRAPHQQLAGIKKRAAVGAAISLMLGLTLVGTVIAATGWDRFVNEPKIQLISALAIMVAFIWAALFAAVYGARRVVLVRSLHETGQQRCPSCSAVNKCSVAWICGGCRHDNRLQPNGHPRYTWLEGCEQCGLVPDWYTCEQCSKPFSVSCANPDEPQPLGAWRQGFTQPAKPPPAKPSPAQTFLDKSRETVELAAIYQRFMTDLRADSRFAELPKDERDRIEEKLTKEYRNRLRN